MAGINMADFLKIRQIIPAIIIPGKVGWGGVILDRGHFGHSGVILDNAIFCLN